MLAHDNHNQEHRHVNKPQRVRSPLAHLAVLVEHGLILAVVACLEHRDAVLLTALLDLLKAREPTGLLGSDIISVTAGLLQALVADLFEPEANRDWPPAVIESTVDDLYGVRRERHGRRAGSGRVVGAGSGAVVGAGSGTVVGAGSCTVVARAAARSSVRGAARSSVGRAARSSRGERQSRRRGERHGRQLC